jgi:hypothetical protein
LFRPRPPCLVLAAALLCGCSSDPDPVARGCIKSTACGVKAYPRLSDCLDGYRNLQVPAGLAPVLNAIYTCVEDAADCAAVRACHGAGQSCDSTYQASCAGDKAVFCDLIDYTTYSYDCAAHGLGCEIRSAGGKAFDATCTGGSGGGAAAELDCGGGLCERTGESCTTGNDFDRCDGDRLEVCIDDRWVSIDCGKLGLGSCQQAQYGAACGAI